MLAIIVFLFVCVCLSFVGGGPDGRSLRFFAVGYVVSYCRRAHEEGRTTSVSAIDFIPTGDERVRPGFCVGGTDTFERGTTTVLLLCVCFVLAARRGTPLVGFCVLRREKYGL